jgi:hypothetical protein
MKQPFLFLIASVIIFFSCSKTAEDINNHISSGVFKNPPAEYRSAPFYSLNDKLDTAEITKQVYGFSDEGFGGFFMHSRGGLITGYMGKEWWQAIDAAVAASKRTGIKSWLYDEDKWPSGFGGGLVPLKSEDYHARCLSRINKNQKPGNGERIIFEDDRFRYIEHKSMMGSSWFDGTTYVDLLNPETVKAFIECSYKPYLERYSSELGKTIPGIFTDEPQVSPGISGGMEGSVSFSPVIIERFREMHSYDLLPVLSSLFDTTGDYIKIRYDYYQTLSKCFEESFTKQIGEYCAEHNAIFTGHFNGEETFKSAMTNSGNSMINYRHMQMPGIDHLGLHFIPLNVPRSVSSVANQYGISRRLCESYGISGQNMNFEDRKWLLDFLTVNGMNFIVPHLALYSMKGERKRDYPPNFNKVQPYWNFNRLFEDYTGRMCYVNTIGKFGAEILIIHPLESEYPGVPNNCYQEYDKLLNMLQKNHRDFDLGDEQILDDIAKVVNKKFTVGKMAYKVIILSDMLVIRNTTLELLKEFHDAGGKVLVCGRYPEYVDGRKSPDTIKELETITTETRGDKLLSFLDTLSPAPYLLEGTGNELIWTHYRTTSQGGLLQLSNTSRLKEINIDLKFLDTIRNLILWNPENGQSMRLNPGADGAAAIHFARTQTWIVSWGDASREGDKSNVYQIPSERKELIKIKGPWNGHRVEPNALTLDFARFSTDNGKSFSNPEPVIGIHQRLREKNYNGNLTLKFETSVSEIPDNCSLVVEQPKLYKCLLNGKKIEFDDNDFYLDRAFGKAEITNMLQLGINKILLSLEYISPQPSSLDAVKRYGTEIESIYLTGNFAVDAEISRVSAEESQKYLSKQLPVKPVNHLCAFTISKETNKFDGDLALNGYPFYAGSFVINNSFVLDQKISIDKKYYISFPSFESIVIKVKVNDHELEPMIFSPWETEITDAVREGENHIEILLVNSLRNLLGPHHNSGGELNEVGPVSFTGNPGWPATGGESNWYDLRIKGKASLWRDDYCMIPFGLLTEPVISETILNQTR